VTVLEALRRHEGFVLCHGKPWRSFGDSAVKRIYLHHRHLISDQMGFFGAVGPLGKKAVIHVL